jgi:hypothetical protein
MSAGTVDHYFIRYLTVPDHLQSRMIYCVMSCNELKDDADGDRLLDILGRSLGRTLNVDE